jgi:hypothetical protein
MKIPIAASIAALALALAPVVGASPLSTYLLDTPCRFLDTRDDVQFFYERPGPYPFGHVLQFYLLQGNCGVPVGAKGAILNVTITAPTVDGHLALFTPPSDGTTQSVVPTTSVLNFKAGQTVANGTIVRLSPYFSPANADLGIYPHVPGGEVHVIIDVVGYLR